MNLARAWQALAAGNPAAAGVALGPADAPAAHRDPRHALALAATREAAGDPAAALATLEALTAERPEFAAGHLHLGIARLDRLPEPDAAGALAAFDRVLELQPPNDVAASYRALALLNLGRDNEARTVFRARGFNDNRMFRVRLTEWMEARWLADGRFFGRPDDSPSLPEPAASANPPPGRGETRRREKAALAHHYAHQFDGVLDQLAPLLAPESPDAGVVLHATLAEEMLGRPGRALALLRRLPPETEAGPWPDVYLAALGRALCRHRRWREAAEVLNRVEITGPEDFGANYHFALICHAAGRRAEARRLWLRAHTRYLVDTLETQWWQSTRALTSDS